MPRMTSLGEETPGWVCEACLADLSWLPDQARFCCFCGDELEDTETNSSELNADDLLRIMLQ